jgi:hypothetical protein
VTHYKNAQFTPEKYKYDKNSCGVTCLTDRSNALGPRRVYCRDGRRFERINQIKKSPEPVPPHTDHGGILTVVYLGIPSTRIVVPYGTAPRAIQTCDPIDGTVYMHSMSIDSCAAVAMTLTGYFPIGRVHCV